VAFVENHHPQPGIGKALGGGHATRTRPHHADVGR
jgi:hypothetical protein